MVKKYSDLYSDIRKRLLAQEDSQSAGFLARNILCHVAQKTHEQLVADRDLYAPDGIIQASNEATDRLLAGEPLAYILGQWEFYGLKLQVSQDVLIPRDDTCAVTDLAIKQGLFLPPNPRVLDLCTGSGCIGLAIASRLKDAKVTCADISREAMAIAKKNIASLKMGSRVSCVQADAMEDPAVFLGKFDMIVSNPPYITTEEMQELPHSVKDYEPHLALHGGADGLDFYRSIAQKYRLALKPNGLLCFEFGMGQGDAVCRILEENGYTILERSRDYNDIERAVIARYDRKD
mgnify:CR=1 FL=1